jgi:hypothetical protein
LANLGESDFSVLGNGKIDLDLISNQVAPLTQWRELFEAALVNGAIVDLEQFPLIGRNLLKLMQ